jgi:hypothetical protein
VRHRLAPVLRAVSELSHDCLAQRLVAFTLADPVMLSELFNSYRRMHKFRSLVALDPVSRRRAPPRPMVLIAGVCLLGRRAQNRDTRLERPRPTIVHTSVDCVRLASIPTC